MKKQLSELSLEELKKKRTTREVLTGIFAGMVLVNLIVDAFDYYNTGVFNYRYLISLFLIILLVILFSSINKLINEIKSREKN